MKKIVVGISFILLVMIIMMKTVLAVDYKVNLKTSKSELSKNEEFVVEAEISGLNTSKGVAVLMGTIEFDANSLTLVKIEGQNGWSAPSYNKNNGKFISASKCTYTPNSYLENSNTENHFFKNFIGKIRRRFGL